jgi:lipoteichoic acid synthase
MGAIEMEEISINKSYKVTNIESKIELRIYLFMAGFIIVNVIKLSLFNFMIIYTKSVEVLMYKMIYTLLISLILYFFITKIKIRLVLIILYAAQAIYIFAYLSYFSYFQSYLHLFQASALLTESIGPITHLSIPLNFNMLIIFIDLPLFIAVMINYRKIINLNRQWELPRKYILISSVFLILCFEGWNYFNNCFINQLGKNFFTMEPKIVQRYGTIINNITDVIFNYGGKNIIKSFKYGKAISAFAKTTSSPNFISIQVESMDSNIVNFKYNDKYITPFLHSLTESSIYYPYTLSYHKAGGTSDIEFSVLNSIEPLSDFPSIKISKYTYPNSMIKRLNMGNYYTMAFHGNKASFYSRGTAFSKMGFKEFNDIKKMSFYDVGWGAPDNDVFQYALKEIKMKKLPFFSYIITMSSHMPFTSVDNYYHNFDYDNIHETNVRNYFNSMSYVDKSIENFVDEIKLSFPNTYVLIWGDHTPDINTCDYKQASYSSENKYFEFVPLFIMTPDKIKYKENANAASFLDIAPTILYASGIKFSISSDGMNLISPQGARPKIPFKEKLYDRNELFIKARQSHKNN